MADSSSKLFEEQFEVFAVDRKKYDRAARISACSLDGYISLELDINTELLQVASNENIEVALTANISLDGSRDDDKTWREVSKPNSSTLADEWQYVCYGKVYKFEDGKADKTLKVYVSFGGLLLALEGPDSKLTPLRVENIYLLLRK